MDGYIAIGTPFGVILQFESLENLQSIIKGLTRMAKWAATQESAKLAYIMKPDNLSQEDSEWLDKFTDNLPDAKL